MPNIDHREKQLYSFLPRTDGLTEEDFELTMEAYKANPDLYADVVEWVDESIYAVWDGFFKHLKDFILQLPPEAKALVIGCGTLRDTLMLLLLNKEVSATAIDLSPEMIEVGRSKINLETIFYLAKLISETQDYENGWIGEIMKAYGELESNLPGLAESTVFQELVLGNIDKRLNLLVEDARALSPVIANNFDIIIASAVIQHIPDWYSVIRDLILRLKPGGTLQFNVRMDVAKGDSGRIFEDRKLNDMPRRYNTFTNREIGELVQRIYDDEELDVDEVTTKEARSFEPGKPNFKGFVVTRREN